MNRAQVLFSVLLGAGLLCALLVDEVRRPDAKRAPRALLALLALGLLLSSYLMSGQAIPGDGRSHLARSWIMFDTLRGGELPLWSNRWYMGFPGELHYGPLYYLSAALFVGLMGGKLYFGTKLLLWTLHLASAASAYWLGLQRYQERNAAVLLALVYSLCGFHLDSLRSDGKLPLSLLYALAPLLFAQLDKLARAESQRLLVSAHAAMLCALCFATHAQYGAYLLVGYLFSAGLFGVLRSGQRARFMLHALECGLLSAALIAWLLAPSLLEADYLNISAGEALANVMAGDYARLRQYLLDMATPMFGRPPFTPGYLGLSSLALAFYGLVLTRGGLRARTLPYPLLLALLGAPWPAFGQLRSDILIFIGVILLAADGYAALQQRTRFRYLLACVACLVLVDSGEGLVKDAYGEHDTRPFNALAKKLRNSGIPGRVLTLQAGGRTFWPSMDTVSSNLSTPFGAVPQLATRALGPTLAITTHVARELIDRGEALSQESADLLRLIGVRYVLLGRRQKRLEAQRFPPVLFAANAERVQWDPVLPFINITAGQAFAAREIPSEGVRASAQRMSIDPNEARAARVLVSDDALGTLTSGQDGRFALRAFAERQREVALRFFAERAGYLRLAYAYAPIGHAILDGVEVPFSRDAFGAVALRVPAGEHRLVYRMGVSSLRLWLLALAVVTLGLCLSVSRRSRRAL